ncbi:CDP-glycerol glycerophosphotransferase family protein [Catenisphaera adipataccumulans]|jgi:CDP-glycerol glycerophosphotransferase|uniref:CDP-glycerol glycerophosphotransferase n=1 Tax=Catenisphaera adipataccumulans TaxID=700500 RepID=A0A7W8FXL1_9FIRM|nr:CDP-glycerol glycerophosphotransferase family protein [Catenisphaera adipataccumulans]MBB5183865.1 CDP-glycerol glycerophosphotransferase [Catenisphaera adipataccumulans]
MESKKTWKQNMIRHAKRMAIRCFKVVYKVMLKCVKTDDHTVIFIAFHGRGYTCNPKYIHIEMLKQPRFDNYHLVWALKNTKTSIERSQVIRYNSLTYFYYMCKAKYWIVNCKLPGYIQKKPDQVYLQTWHGTPLKRLAYDIVETENQTFYRSGMSRKQMTDTYDNDVKKYNYMIAPNPFSFEVFQTAFRIEPERLIKTGYPRNDFLTNITKQEIIDLKQKYNIPGYKKVILYAPTWRDNSYNTRGYTFELKADFRKWKQVLGDEYIVIFKPHYLIINRFENDPTLQDFIINIDANADINDLYVISDVLVTDYSSVFFDYANLRRPMYFYMFDLKEYADELRGFYFDIYETMPGDIIEDEDTLLADIKAGKYDYDRLDRFNKQFNVWQDGKASERVIDIVFGKED